jgi:hypothetical protein
MGMNIFEKITEARNKFLSANIKPTGSSGGDRRKITYFELSDILPPSKRIEQELKFCPAISFTADLATMTVYDCEKPADMVVFTSPMSSAKLSGCHDVQNLGAVQTYLKRYLYYSLYDVIEHDDLDGTLDLDKKPKQPKQEPQEQQPFPKLTELSIDEVPQAKYGQYIKEYIDGTGITSDEVLNLYKPFSVERANKLTFEQFQQVIEKIKELIVLKEEAGAK